MAFVSNFHGLPFPDIATKSLKDLNRVTSATVLIISLDIDADLNYIFEEKVGFITPRLGGAIANIGVVTRKVPTNNNSIPQGSNPDTPVGFVENPEILEKRKELEILYAGTNKTTSIDLTKVAEVVEESESNIELKKKLKEVPIELQKPEVIKETKKVKRKIDLGFLEDLVDLTLDEAKKRWERRAREEAEESLQEIEEKAPGRPWDIVNPLPNPIKAIPSFIELKPAPDTLKYLEEKLQPEQKTDTFIQPQELKLIE